MPFLSFHIFSQLHNTWIFVHTNYTFLHNPPLVCCECLHCFNINFRNSKIKPIISMWNGFINTFSLRSVLMFIVKPVLCNQHLLRNKILYLKHKNYFVKILGNYLCQIEFQSDISGTCFDSTPGIMWRITIDCLYIVNPPYSQICII